MFCCHVERNSLPINGCGRIRFDILCCLHQRSLAVVIVPLKVLALLLCVLLEAMKPRTSPRHYFEVASLYQHLFVSGLGWSKVCLKANLSAVNERGISVLP